MHKINAIWAFVGIDADGDEGVPAFFSPALEMMMPLVGADERRVEALRKEAQMIADSTGLSLELRKYTVVEVLDVIKPNTPLGDH